MRNHVARYGVLALLFGATLVLAGQNEHVTPFTGTWKLNLARSNFNPGPPFKAFIITFTPDGVRHLDLTNADGHHLKISLPWSGGKPVSPSGIADTVTTSKIRGRTVHEVWEQNGKVIEDVHGVLSPDGKTLKVTVSGTDKQGCSYHNELTFDKQPR